MKKLNGLMIAGSLAAVIFGIAHLTAGTNLLPIESNVVSQHEFLVGVDDNNVRGTSTPTVSGTLTIGLSGTALSQMTVYSQVLTPLAAVTTATCAEESFTVTGVTTADDLILNFAGAISGNAVPVTARVSDADSVVINFCNAGAVTDTPAAGTFNIIGIRS